MAQLFLRTKSRVTQGPGVLRLLMILLLPMLVFPRLKMSMSQGAGVDSSSMFNFILFILDISSFEKHKTLSNC